MEITRIAPEFCVACASGHDAVTDSDVERQTDTLYPDKQWQVLSMDSCDECFRDPNPHLHIIIESVENGEKIR